VAKKFGSRIAVFGVAFALAAGLAGTRARADLDVYVGARNVVKNEPLSSCNDKAKSALMSVLGRVASYGDTGNWLGTGAYDASGSSFAAATIHCYPLDELHGYVVTFTCASQTPPATEAASAICDKLASAFGGQQ
jgi:hypothetical protein